jgi:hypothetical protein
MSEQPEFYTYTRDEFMEEFVHPDDRAAIQDARQKRALQVRAEYLTEMRKNRPDPGRGRRGHGRIPAARLGDRERLGGRTRHPS